MTGALYSAPKRLPPAVNVAVGDGNGPAIRHEPGGATATKIGLGVRNGSNIDAGTLQTPWDPHS